MYKIVYNSWKFLYIECIKLKKKKNSFYIQNCVHCLKIVFLECTKLKICIYWIFRIVYILKKKLCTLNVQNYVHSLRNCVRWMYRIMYIFLKFCIFWKYRILYILCKVAYNKCTRLCTIVENFVHWMYKIEEKKIHSIYKIAYIV